VKLPGICVDQMGEYLAFLLPFEIGTGSRRGYKKLRKISALNTQGLLFHLSLRDCNLSKVQQPVDLYTRVMCAALIVNKAIIPETDLLSGYQPGNFGNIRQFVRIGHYNVCMI